MIAIPHDSVYSSSPLIVGHPDMIEMFFRNSWTNVQILPRAIPNLRESLTDTFGVTWRQGTYGQHGQCLVHGWNDEVRITISGRAGSAENPSLGGYPFSQQRLHEFRTDHPYWYPGGMRLSTKTKSDPYRYCDYLYNVFALIEQLGIDEIPRIIEYALDVYGDPDPFRKAVRLKHDAPRDFCHYGDEGYHPGGSKDCRHTEYSMRSTFQPRKEDPYRKQNRYHRTLTCYHREEQNFYRVELRLGYRYLKHFYGSLRYERQIELPSTPLLSRDYTVTIVSPTLDLIGFMPYFVRTQLTCETMDLESLFRANPVTRYWHLTGQSVRHIRYRLFNAGFSTKDVSKFSSGLKMPSITYVLPRQFELNP